MSGRVASPQELTKIRKLAAEGKGEPIRQAAIDMMAWPLTAGKACKPMTVDRVCGLIVDWIDAGGKVQVKEMLGRDAGLSGYAFVCRTDDRSLYVKVVIRSDPTDGEYLAIVSAHASR